MSECHEDAPSTGFHRRVGAGFALGFGLGGFFDGILLHQILQWHHLLSGIESANRDIRLLILADGLFHLFMYIVAGAGLWLLWRARRAPWNVGDDGRLIASALFGFGVWHMLDGVVSHWVLGLHRIRMDVADPLLWDLGWFALFGVIPALFGLKLYQRPPPGGRRGLKQAPVILTLATLIAAPLAALPASSDGVVMAVFRPDMSQAEMFAAMDAVNGRFIWSDRSGQVWAMAFEDPGAAAKLYGRGALLVGNSVLPAGCLSWIRS
jgi:uncharacterized membrane protein